MVDRNTLAIGVAAGVASEAFGVTDVTPIGRQGDAGQPGGGSSGLPPGLAALLANAQEAGDAIQQGVDTGQNVGNQLEQLAELSEQFQPGAIRERVEEVTRVVPSAAQAGGGGVVEGAQEYVDEQTGGSRGPQIPGGQTSGGDSGGPIDRLNRGIANLETNAETTGQEIGRGLAAGPFGVAEGFVNRSFEGLAESAARGERAGENILESVSGDDERLATTQEVIRGEATLADASFGPVKWALEGELPDVDLGGSAQGAIDTIQDNLNVGGGPRGPRQTSSRDRDRDDDNDTGRDASRDTTRMARNDDEARAGGDPAADPADERGSTAERAGRYDRPLGGLR